MDDTHLRIVRMCVCVHVVSETAHMPLHGISGRPEILLSFNTARAHIYIYVCIHHEGGSCGAVPLNHYII